MVKPVQFTGMILLLHSIVAYRAYGQSIKIATTSERDSLVLKIRLDEKVGLRIFFEDRLYADLPPFAEKMFAIEPQRDWQCIGLRDTEKTVDIIIYQDCQKATYNSLKQLWKAEEIPEVIAGWRPTDLGLPDGSGFRYSPPNHGPATGLNKYLYP